MKGNFHVRFRGECGRGNPPALTRYIQTYSKQKKGLRVRKAQDPGIRESSLNRIWTTSCHVGLRHRGVISSA
jgi:hypothetical protein